MFFEDDSAEQTKETNETKDETQTKASSKYPTDTQPLDVSDSVSEDMQITTSSVNSASSTSSSNYNNPNYLPMPSQEDMSVSSVSIASSRAERLDLVQVDITDIPLPEIKEEEADFQDDVIGNEWQPSELMKGVPTVQGNITLQRRLGSGAFGVVYRGVHENRLVALKELNIGHAKGNMSFLFEKDFVEGVKDLQEAFEWEVLGLQGLAHPNVVGLQGIYRGKDKQGRPRVGMVMPLCERGSLEGVVKKLHLQGKRLSNACIWKLALEMAHGLSYLHGQGRVHRDLKTENVLLDKFGKALLADLGVAQVADILRPQHQKEARVIEAGIRDIQWMSPEEFLQGASAATAASDIYSLGLILLYLLTGEKPYEKAVDWKAQDFALQARQVIALQGYREIIPSYCPEPLRKLITACWSQKPEDRPTADAVLQQLEARAPQLHHEGIVTNLLPRLDSMIEEQRSQFAHFLEPYTTPKPLEEDPDTYWQRWEKRDKTSATLKNKTTKTKEEKSDEKVETAGTETTKEKTESKQEEKITDITLLPGAPQRLGQVFNSFMANPEEPVLVCLSDVGGLGKSLSTFVFADRLLKTRTVSTSNYLPLPLRPGITHWCVSALRNGIHTALTSKTYGLNEAGVETLKSLPVLFILDGIDELEFDEAITNLLEMLGASNWPRAKFLITTRTRLGDRQLSLTDLGPLFGRSGKYDVCYFLPFSLEQMFSSLEKRLHWSKEIREQYEARQQEAPSLRAALRNPFVLNLFVQSFDTVSKKDFKTLTRREIYKAFIEHGLAASHALLSPRVIAQLEKAAHPHDSRLLESFYSLVEQVAYLFYERNTLTVDLSLLQTILQVPVVQTHLTVPSASPITSDSASLLALPETATRNRRSAVVKPQEETEPHPWLRLPELVEEAAKQDYTHTYHSEAAQKRKAIIILSDYLKLTQNHLTLFGVLLPVKFREGKVSFIHKSFFEYFLSTFILRHCEESDNSPTNQTLIPILNLRNLQEEQGAIELAAEGLQEDKHIFKAEPEWAAGVLVNHNEMALLSLMKQSVYPSRFSQAAGNAITLLKRAGISFSGMIFPKLHAENIDGSFGVFRGAGFTGAKLINFNVTGGDLNDMQCQNAILTLITGEQPALALKDSVNAIAYSKDGRFMAVGSGWDIDLFEAHTGRHLHTFEGHTGSVTSVTFSPDGKLLASGSNKTVRLCDVATKQHHHTFEGHMLTVTSVAFSPDGKLLASGSWDNTVRLCDVATKQHHHTFEGHTNTVTSVAFSPDGKLLASGSWDNTVRLCDVATKQHHHTFEGHTDIVESVAFSPDGKLLASGSWDNTVRLYEMATKQHQHTFEGHTEKVTSVTFSPDGKLLASGSWDNTVRLCDVATKQHQHTFEGHTKYVTSVAFSPDGKLLASGSDDNTVRLCDVATKQHHHTFKGHTEEVTSVAFSPDGKLLASGSQDKTVRLCDVATKQHHHTFKGHTDTVTSVAFSPDGKLLASGSNKTVRLCDVATKQHHHTFEGHTDYVTSVAFSPDGKLLASGSNKTVRLCDVATKQHHHTFEGHMLTVTSVAFSPDGKLLASGSDDKTVRLCDVATKQHHHTFEGHTEEVTSVAFSPDGKLLASGSLDKTVHLCDVATKQHHHTFEGHTSWVMSIAFSPDGKLFASGSWDNTVRLWSISSGQCLKVVVGFTGRINSLAFQQTPMQLLLVTGGYDKAVRLFELVKTASSEASFRIILRWTTTQGALSAFETNLAGTHIDEMSARLLKQRGAIGEPKIKEIQDEKHEVPSSTRSAIVGQDTQLNTRSPGGDKGKLETKPTLKAPPSSAAFFKRKKKPPQPTSSEKGQCLTM